MIQWVYIGKVKYIKIAILIRSLKNIIVLPCYLRITISALGSRLGESRSIYQ